MNANELTFGVEIETVVSYEAAASNGLQIGAYHVGTQVPYLPAGWTAQRDSSLYGNSGETDCEIVSPVLKGADGLLEVLQAVRTLEAKGHRVNKTCGIHVHVGWDVAVRTQKELARLVCIVANYEAALYAMTGTKNRERGHYCKKVSDYGDADRAARISQSDRYHGLNLSNLATGRKPTVEFRFFAGSLNPVKLAGYVQACLALVERAINSKRVTAFTAKPTGHRNSCKRDGAGATAVARFLFNMHWFNSKKAPAGILTDAVSLADIRKEFTRLANKYDAMA